MRLLITTLWHQAPYPAPMPKFKRTPVFALLSSAILAACAPASAPLRAGADVPPQRAGVAPAEYFWDRLSYPTGRLDARWAVAAVEDAAKIAQAVPSGIARNAGEPPVWRALGPAPLDHGQGFFGGQGEVGGRINVIVAHPTNPAIAWAGSDGGGVWKTSNCCGVDTVWTVKTDSPEVATSAIGELVLDPNNPDVLYAGTGDLRYTSFSFGASGVLKSVDAGEHWQTLGLSSFSGFYPPSAGGFPQYQAIGKIAVDPANSNYVVVGTKTGLY